MKTKTTVAILWLSTLCAGAFAQEAIAPSIPESIRDSFPSGYDALLETYDASAIPELVAMLDSEDDEQYWPRVVGALGVIGDEETVGVLIDRIEKPIFGPVYISQAQHNTRREAMRALGFLAARTGSERALDYLIESLDDGIWRRRNIVGVVAHLDSYSSYDRRLTIYAIFGLALSGRPRAGAALRSLQQSPTREQARLELGDVVDAWLEVYELVEELGVSGMYEHQRLNPKHGQIAN